MAKRKNNLMTLRAIVLKSLDLLYKRKHKDSNVDADIPNGTDETVLLKVAAVVDGESFENEFEVPVKKGHPTTARVNESPDAALIISSLLDRLPEAEANRFLAAVTTRFESEGNTIFNCDPATLAMVRDVMKVRRQSGETTRAGAIATPKIKNVKRRAPRIRKLS